jgi:aspartyl-tRNA(Asn)/glutamyl-tRNA(Gln) amidotransferase subunit B
MEEGSFRCDANISLKPAGQSELGTKVELKNMNSFRHVQNGLAFEIERQKTMLADGETIVQETRLWDADRGITTSMRSKEEAHDYRYFPDPDLQPVAVSAGWIESIRAGLPELPQGRRERFVRDFKLPDYDAEVLTGSRQLADYFEACVTCYPQPKKVSNWIMGELLRLLNESKKSIGECLVNPSSLAAMLSLVDKGVISGTTAKKVFEEMYATGKEPSAIVASKGLEQVSDQGELGGVIDGILAAHPRQVEEYRQGKEKVFGFFVGEAMKATRGKANPQLINELLKKKLGEHG